MYENFKKKALSKVLLEEIIKKEKRNVKEKEKELEDCLEDINNHKLAYTQLEDIISNANKVFIQNIENLLNKAIQTIFYDEDYSIKVIVENKKMNFELIDNNNIDEDNNPLQIDLDDACGGGIITVVGFILQLFVIEMLKLNKVIFIDEGFMALSEKYRPLFYDFINEFCKNTDMKILLVSHDELVKEKAVQEIEIEHGKDIKEGERNKHE